MADKRFDTRIRLRHIQCLVAVAQERHLGRAAEKLSLSQPSVSKTLLELETLLGARLVERGRFGARLTREGQAFLVHAVAMLDALEDARRSVDPGDVAAQASVLVGALPTVAPDLLPAALSEFRLAWPNARVSIEVAANTPLLDRLRSGEVDFALGRMADPQAMAGVSFELLYAEPLIVAVRAGHPLLAQGAVSLHDVIRHPLVVSTRGTVPRHNTDTFLQSRGLRLPAHHVETLSVAVARLAVLQSDAAWFTPMGAVREDIAMGLLRELPLPFEGTEEPVGLLHRSEARLGPAARELMAMLRQAAAARRAPAPSWKLRR